MNGSIASSSYDFALDYLMKKYNKATLDPAELASETGRSGTHVRRMCSYGEIKSTRFGGRWVIPIAECARVLSGE